MNSRRSEVAYEVTISEELRALRRVRNSPVARLGDSGETERSDHASAQHDIFLPRRLRRDGRRPVTVSASELLRVEVCGNRGDPSRTGGERTGFQAVSLFLTEDGTCLAQVCVEPSEGALARPSYRLADMRDAADVLAIVKACQSDTRVHASALRLRPGENPAPGPDKALSNELVEALAPFLETT